ncbi:MAG: RtcB family protein [Gemmataceae bacterium]
MPKETYSGPLEQVDECCWRIPKSYKPGMKVDGLIFTSEKMLAQLKKDQAPEQVANVAFLPGIQHASLAMPDIHWGYGFCIGGVCATDPDEGGVISPGGVGYDINCGVRLMRTGLFYRDVVPHVRRLVDALFTSVPTGVGKVTLRVPRRRIGPHPRRRTAAHLVARGLATQSDIDPRGRQAEIGSRSSRSPTTPRCAGPSNAARSARATTSSRCRSSTPSSTKTPRTPSASPRTRSAS